MRARRRRRKGADARRRCGRAWSVRGWVRAKGARPRMRMKGRRGIRGRMGRVRSVRRRVDVRMWGV